MNHTNRRLTFKIEDNKKESINQNIIHIINTIIGIGLEFGAKCCNVDEKFRICHLYFENDGLGDN